MGPFAAALMQRIGIRRTVALSLALMAATIGASTFISAPWQLIVTWGFLIGLTSGTGRWCSAPRSSIGGSSRAAGW